MQNKHNYVCKVSNIPSFIDLDILKKYVVKDIESNKEYFDEMNLTYKISESKKAEWIIYKSIKESKMVGSGHNNIDILYNNIGIDVGILSLSRTYTNEKSIIQNFSTAYKLDKLFNDGRGEDATNIFKNKLIDKFSKNSEYDKLYYILFICHKKHIYLTCIKLYRENIKHITFSCFTQSCKSIIIDNFIHPDIGNVKLYQSKKELN